MTEMEAVAGVAFKTWGTKTLSQLCAEAARELNGTCFENIRTASGRRFLMVVCLTGEYEIAKAQHIFEFHHSDTLVNWNEASVFDMIMNCVKVGGFSYVEQRDPITGKTNALLLIAAEPRSMQILENLLHLPE